LQILCFAVFLCRVGFGAEQISRWLAERADVQVMLICQFLILDLLAPNLIFTFLHASASVFLINRGLCLWCGMVF